MKREDGGAITIALMETLEQKIVDLTERNRALEERVTALESALIGFGRTIQHSIVAPKPKKASSTRAIYDSVPKNCCPSITITNLSQKTRSRDLRDIFNRYGLILHYLRQSDGCVKIYYNDVRDANDAVRNMDGQEVDGSLIKVTWAVDSRDAVV